MFLPTGCLFLRLKSWKFFPRWRQHQAELLLAAFEAALRLSARTRASQAPADAPHLARLPAVSASAAACGTGYLACWAQQQKAEAQQGEAGISAAAAERLLAGLACLASTAFKRATAAAAGGQRDLGPEENALLGTLRNCLLAVEAAPAQAAGQHSMR